MNQQKLTEEEKGAIFWEQVKAKRIMQALVSVIPFYISWLFTSLLMINRDYGRPAIALFCFGFAVAEGVSMVFWTTPEVKLIINSVLILMPDTYTLAETLRVFRAFFPVLLTLILTMLDFTMDKLPENAPDPLAIMKKILAAQAILEKEAEALEKELDTTPYPEKGWQTFLGEESFVGRVKKLQLELHEFASQDLLELSEENIHLKEKA